MLLQRKRQQGFSLLEMLLASSLGLILLAGVMDVYFSIKSSYNLQLELAQLQENGRLASYILRHAVKDAKLIGYKKLPGYLRKKINKSSEPLIVGKGGHEEAYFIAKTSRKNSVGQYVYALYKSIDEGRKNELLPNIVDMKVDYGIVGSDARVKSYKPAVKITSWDKVRSAFVILYIREDSKRVRKWPLYLVLS